MKSGFPYLVDIGVGSFCPFVNGACPVPCYTSSKREGDFARFDFLAGILPEVLVNSNVFEVVFGGGEPSFYNCGDKKLSDVLKSFHDLDFKVGVTTRNYKWHKMPDFEKCLPYMNSIAVSVNSVEDVEDSLGLVNSLKWENNYYYQYILGLDPLESFIEFIEYMKKKWARVTLLGYKDFGLARGVKPFEFGASWIDIVKRAGLNSLGIDSILANRWRDELTKRGVQDYLLVGGEGESSCYINALEQVLQPSSFSEHKIKLDDNLTSESFLKHFSTF